MHTVKEIIELVENGAWERFYRAERHDNAENPDPEDTGQWGIYAVYSQCGGVIIKFSAYWECLFDVPGSFDPDPHGDGYYTVYDAATGYILHPAPGAVDWRAEADHVQLATHLQHLPDAFWQPQYSDLF